MSPWLLHNIIIMLGHNYISLVKLQWKFQKDLHSLWIVYNAVLIDNVLLQEGFSVCRETTNNIRFYDQIKVVGIKSNFLRVC